MLNWRQVYLAVIVLRFVFGLSDSYIHPDEHFQSLEVLTSQILGFKTAIPWEFSSDQPARSFGPLYLFYGPLLYTIKYFGIKVSPLGIWYLARLQLIICGWLATDMCLYRILPTKPERVKAVFFTLTSYITLVYQSHCFSNSLETPLVLYCVMLISDFRFDLEIKNNKANYEKLFYFGAAIAVGIFNRVTFPAFLLLPSYFAMKYLWRFKLGVLPFLLGFLIPTISFITLDTALFKGDNWVITPLNNLIYNSSRENLALHGIHPYYTHIVVNLPQIFGPLLIVLFYNFKNTYYKTVPFLSFVSGLLILSLIPHQELRFLIPLVPLACSCLDFNRISGVDTENEEIKEKIAQNEKNLKPLKVLSKKSTLANILLISWYLFNFVMCILMGVLHQGGVVPALNYLHNSHQDYIQIWWRTYSPPTWLLGSENANMGTLDKYTPDHNIIDAMGSSQQSIYNLVDDLLKEKKKVILIAPVASVNCDFDTSILKLIWTYNYHLDLDHLNFDSVQCIKPGLGIYEFL